MNIFIRQTLMLLLALVATSVYAQEDWGNDDYGYFNMEQGSNMIEFNVGDPNIAANSIDCDDFWHLSSGDDSFDPNGPNGDWFKSDYVVARRMITMAYSVNYQRAIVWWLQIGFNISTAVYKEEYNHRESYSHAFTAKSTIVNFIPNVRFNYFNRRYFGMYSAVGAGFYYLKEDNYEKINNDKVFRTADISFTGQLTFIGLRVGGKLYANFEFGVGPKGILNAGVGYRF
ncbi:MAG: hypothetical protein HUJ96_06755 [Marinilabiliaceae bacterium]|nr:hypothetical protein [Marinilabiliaceae bacterium]